MLLWRCCTQYTSKFGKLRTGKCQFSFQSQRKAMPKDVPYYCTIALISHANKVMLKILQAKLQEYVYHEIIDIQAGFKKTEEPEINCQHPLDHWKGKRVPEKHLLLLYWLWQSLECVDHKKLENYLRDGSIRPPYCLLKNLYAGQEATVRTGHGTTDWFQIRKRVHQSCILSPCLFILY